MDVHAQRRVRDAEPVGERAGDAEPDARLVHVLAQVPQPLVAAPAGAAGLDRDAGHAVTGCDSVHVRPNLDDLACELVPEHLPGLDERALEVGVQVGAADPARLHGEHDVPRPADRLGRLLHGDRPDAAKHADAHRASLRHGSHAD